MFSQRVCTRLLLRRRLSMMPCSWHGNLAFARLCSSETKLANHAINTSPTEQEVDLPPSTKQLIQLGLTCGIPFVGFGFMDNAVMILAGDAIDVSLGTKFGISTLAAAGLGNLFSDVIGLGAGDAIEDLCKRCGLREPKLTDNQADSTRARATKVLGQSLGISFGCLLGMFPLFFLSDRKPLHFDEEQLAMYNQIFQSNGVTPQSYFELMKIARWRTANPGETMVARGKKQTWLIFLASGVAESKSAKDRRVSWYRGRLEEIDVSDDIQESAFQGDVIGGRAMIEENMLDLPYPKTICAITTCRYIEWDIQELRELMNNDQALAYSFTQLLSKGIAENVRRRLKTVKQRTKVVSQNEADAQELAEHAKEVEGYHTMMRLVINRGQVEQQDKVMITEYASRHGITYNEHMNALEDLGWTAAEWMRGGKEAS